MKKFALSLVLTAAVPGVASAKPVTPVHRATYVRLYHTVAHRFGKRAPGCQLGRTCHKPFTDEAVMKSIVVLNRMLNPPPVGRTLASPLVHHTITSTAPNPTQSYAPTPSSGHCGAYQFDYQTWKSIGMPGSPCGASPATQDAAAIKLHSQRGNEPWPHCGQFFPDLAAVRQCENSGSYAP